MGRHSEGETVVRRGAELERTSLTFGRSRRAESDTHPEWETKRRPVTFPSYGSPIPTKAGEGGRAKKWTTTSEKRCPSATLLQAHSKQHDLHKMERGQASETGRYTVKRGGVVLTTSPAVATRYRRAAAACNSPASTVSLLLPTLPTPLLLVLMLLLVVLMLQLQSGSWMKPVPSKARVLPIAID
ncbi:unnamed protein product [Merluccius merluccius]